jgi:hypothetical protein
MAESSAISAFTAPEPDTVDRRTDIDAGAERVHSDVIAYATAAADFTAP